MSEQEVETPVTEGDQLAHLFDPAALARSI